MRYNKTGDYHWPEIEKENSNVVITKAGNLTEAVVGKGPFGFQSSIEVAAGEVYIINMGLLYNEYPNYARTFKQCLVKSDYQLENDECILTPKSCKKGISFSIWEKVHYKTDIFNVYKEHEKQYIFSTGGDYDYAKSKAYPGMAVYHQGMNLVAVVSTGDDVWSLSVTGQLMNETWANIGVTWEPHKSDPKLDWDKRGGLTVRAA